MRSIWLVLVVMVLVVTGLVAFGPSGAQQPNPEAGKGEPPRPHIVPVVLIKAGESKELLLSMSFTLG